MADLVGQQLGNYRLSRLLGKGGFADVYLGEHVYLETQAAIKVLLTQLASKDIEEFRLEAKRVAHLEHPNIVRVLEFGVEAGTPFLVMNYAPNGTLRQRHPRGTRLPLPLVVNYVRQVADALQYAHEEKFIHRDVKPENILLGRRNEVLLSDFGIAIVDHSTKTQHGQGIAGTVSYMAPEQLQGKAVFASDQYALGIVAYEWLSGALPFQGTSTEVANQHIFAPPPPLHERIQDISPTLELAILTALEKDPQQRYNSVKALAKALERASDLTHNFRSAPTVSPSQIGAHLATSIDQSNFAAASPASHEQKSEADIATEPQHVEKPSVVPEQIETPVPHISPRPLNKRRSLPLIGLLLVLALLLAGIPLFIALHHTTTATTPNVTATAAARMATVNSIATSTSMSATATATGTQNPYSPYRGTLALDDPLKTNNGSWYESTDATWNSGSGCKFTAGAYHIKFASPNYCLSTFAQFSNFVFQIQMTIDQGNRAGIIFRADSSQQSYYYFYLSTTGVYTLDRIDNANQEVTLQSASDTAIKTGLHQSNLIAVVAQGSQLDFYINHKHVVSITVSSLKAGNIGVAVIDSAGADSVLTEAEFSNARVWTL